MSINFDSLAGEIFDHIRSVGVESLSDHLFYEGGDGVPTYPDIYNLCIDMSNEDPDSTPESLKSRAISLLTKHG